MKIDYITFRDVHNAGDNLIGYTAQRLLDASFSGKLDARIIHLADDNYARSKRSNIVFGPGGIVTGSPDKSVPDRLFLKHITPELLLKWEQQERRIFFFGSGTNANPGYRDFSEVSGDLLRNLVSISSRLYLRGSKDIEKVSQYIRTEDRNKLVFQPCPSIFLDRVFAISPKKEDRVAINFGFGKLTPDALRTHPIRKFIDYVRSHGLKPVLFANHPIDVHESMADIFDGESIYNSPRYTPGTVRQETAANLNRAFPNRMHQDESLAEDFNGFRFAFGSRLHAFLPFTSFGTPAVFLNTREIRKPMPKEYFGLPELSSPFLNRNAEDSVKQMIQRLDWLIKNEGRIVSQIHAERERLFLITTQNLAEMHALMCRPAKPFRWLKAFFG